MPATPSTERFSDRVADYVHYRPSYPPALLDWLQRELGATPAWQVLDVGAGTGISAELFLAAGYHVTAVEPNAAMRTAMVERLGGTAGFEAVNGRADGTGLPAASVDLVTAAQAFHWFDPAAARSEFQRVLRPHGLAAIWWNSRRLTGTAFLEGYEALLQRYGTDYAQVAERYADDASLRAWFGAGLRGRARFEHRQRLDFVGLRGRLLSSSYAPKPGHPNHQPMVNALQQLFDRCQHDGYVSFDYDTRVSAGELA